ncbi:MAG TPA: DUF805 domain-containing protein [Sphingomonas sp.]|nr:DUF805 domain-containing protein [Sphingomonas sp.]
MPLRRYAQFTGRARRQEFWLWVLFVVIVSIILSMVDQALGLGGRVGMGQSVIDTPAVQSYSYGGGFRGGILTDLFALAVLIPNIAVSVRRLHDTDRSGWWIVVPIGFWLLTFAGMFGRMFWLAGIAGLLMLVSSIVLIVFYCFDGTHGPNRFGPDPKAGLDDLHETFS